MLLFFESIALELTSSVWSITENLVSEAQLLILQRGRLLIKHSVGVWHFVL